MRLEAWRRLCLRGAAAFCFCAAVPAMAAHTVQYSGSFSPEAAGRLVWVAAWLDGLQTAGDSLAENSAVRLARLDRLQRQGLAALLDLVDVSVTWPRNPARSPDSEAAAGIGFRAPEGNEISRRLGETEARQRQEEIIAALRRLLPEALDLAAEGHRLREEAVPSPGENAADAPVAGRLAEMTDILEAYALYRQALKGFSGVWENPSAALGLVERALSLAPGEPLLRLAQGELMLLLDRPQGALRALSALRAPVPAGEGKTRDAEDALPAAPDLRFHARVLYLRALAQLQSGMPALAERDLDEALRFAPDWAELWLARGAARQERENFEAMCGDYRQACVFGACDGLTAARSRGLCASARAGS